VGFQAGAEFRVIHQQRKGFRSAGHGRRVDVVDAPVDEDKIHFFGIRDAFRLENDVGKTAGDLAVLEIQPEAAVDSLPAAPPGARPHGYGVVIFQRWSPSAT